MIYKLLGLVAVLPNALLCFCVGIIGYFVQESASDIRCLLSDLIVCALNCTRNDAALSTVFFVNFLTI